MSRPRLLPLSCLFALGLSFSLETCDESFNNGVAAERGSCSLPRSGTGNPPVNIKEEFDEKNLFSDCYNVTSQSKSPLRGRSVNCVKLLDCRWKRSVMSLLCVRGRSFYLYLYFISDFVFVCLMSLLKS